MSERDLQQSRAKYGSSRRLLDNRVGQLKVINISI